MNIAICAPFLEADLLEEKIRRALPEERLFVDEYYDIDTLLTLPSLAIYESVWVALPGVLGMEAVRTIRQQRPEAQVVWVSDDREFARSGVTLQLAMFLMPDSSPEDFRIAVRNSRRLKNLGFSKNKPAET